jgi:hypothetical protein
VLPYFLSKLIAELPFSALFPSIFGVIVYKIAGLNPAPDRLVKFLSIITVIATQLLQCLCYHITARFECTKQSTSRI